MTADDVTLAGIAATNPDKFEVLGNPFTAYAAGIRWRTMTKIPSFVNDVLEQSFGDGTWKKLWEATAGTVLGDAAPAAGEPLLERGSL